jgi:large subunit ribosomal protein L18
MKKFSKKIIGTSQRPRMVVSRSLNNIFVQLIDDINQKTIYGLSSLSLKKRANKEICFKVGELLAQKVLSLGLKKIVFDRANKLYHGRIKAVADGARSKGLEF